MSNVLNRQNLIVALLGLGLSAAALATPTPAERDTKTAAHFTQADSNRDGKLSLDEFKAMKQHQHAEHTMQREQQYRERCQDSSVRDDRRMAARMAEHFMKADTNRDNQISKAEAQREMPRLFEKFDQIDSNKDGQLSKAEIAAGHPQHP